VAAIPGVIAAGQRWTSVWQTTGNNADGPIAAEDGSLLIAQNDNGTVVRIDPKGQVSIAYRDTNTGGALSRSTKGALFVASRGIGTAVLHLEPQRRVFANRVNGDPLECLGGVLNDLTADGRGGVYFTMGGLYYADPKGVVTAYGENLRTNGVILSPDERTLYVTNGQSVAAFDVRPDGSLANQREFATFPAGGGDGLAVDGEGRLYVTVGGGGGERHLRLRSGRQGARTHSVAAQSHHGGLCRSRQEDAVRRRQRSRERGCLLHSDGCPGVHGSSQVAKTGLAPRRAGCDHEIVIGGNHELAGIGSACLMRIP
jgi:sugar lactone lactonase YvrE